MSQFKGTIRSMMGPRMDEHWEARWAAVVLYTPWVGLALIVWHVSAGRA